MIHSDRLLRVQFLARVTDKQCHHLNSTTQRLFSTPFDLEKAQTLDTDEVLSEQIEAFVSRFTRLQDTIGDKFLPYLLDLLGEKKRTFVDNLDTAERLGWLPSTDEWQAMRALRNQMVHEYMEDKTVLVTAIQTAQQFVPKLIAVNTALQQELSQRGWLPIDH